MTIYQDLGTTYEPRVIGYLTAKADEFLLEHFKMRLDVPIKLNGRMVRRFGQFNSLFVDSYSVRTAKGLETFHNVYISDSIDLSKQMLEINSTELVLNVLYHECVHYAFKEIGIDAEDNDPAFEYVLKLFGISSNHHTENCSLEFAMKKNIYVCENPECGRVSSVSLRWKPATYTKKFVCGKCHSRLHFRETIVKLYNAKEEEL